MQGSVKITLVILTPVLLLIIIAGYLWQSDFLSQRAGKHSGPLEKITIGVNRAGFNSLVWIAQNRGFDKVRFVKYRGSLHGSDEYPFLIGENGFSILPVAILGLDYPVTSERISSKTSWRGVWTSAAAPSLCWSTRFFPAAQPWGS